MNTLAEIIIKSSVAIAISYLLYFCFLRNNTRFRWIRIYFLVAVAASLLIPMLSEILALKQQVWIRIPEEYIREFLNGDNAERANNTAFLNGLLPYSLSSIALYLYSAGVIVVLLRFLVGFAHLLFLTIKFGIQKVGNDRLVILQNLPYPFSFLHLIFINRQTLSEGSHGAMLQHERAHVQQWHSLDLMVLELLVAFQWFNPFAWLFRRSVKELHEYLADEEVLRHQPSTLDYQLLLFNQVCGTSFYQPVNGFKSSLTKKRILMMTNNKRNKKWFAILAAFVVAIFAIQSFSRINLAQDPPKKQKADTASMDYPPPPPPPPALAKNANEGNPPPPPPPPPLPFPYYNGTNDFKASNEAFADFIIKNVQLPQKYRGNDRVGIFVALTFNNKGKVINVEKASLPEDRGFETGPAKSTIVDDPDLINAVIGAIKKAPDFRLRENSNGTANQFVYAITFRNNTCKLMPVYYLSDGKSPEKEEIKRLDK